MHPRMDRAVDNIHPRIDHTQSYTTMNGPFYTLCTVEHTDQRGPVTALQTKTPPTT